MKSCIYDLGRVINEEERMELPSILAIVIVVIGGIVWRQLRNRKK